VASSGKIPNLEYLQTVSAIVEKTVPIEVKELLHKLEEYDRMVHIALRHRICPMCGSSIQANDHIADWFKIQSFKCNNCTFVHAVRTDKEPYIPHVPLPSLGGAL
jgi:uncharacterized protein (UPF0212 family)